MRTTRWLRGLILALIVPWGYGLAQGSDAELRDLLHEQYRYAEAYVSASVALAHTVALFEYLLETTDPEDPASAEALAVLADPTLALLAEVQLETIQALITSEERIVELLGNDAVRFPQPEEPNQQVEGVVAGALILLTVVGGVAVAGLPATDAFDFPECTRQFNQSTEQLSVRQSKKLVCVLRNSPGAIKEVLIAGGSAIGQAVVLAIWPHGKVKAVLETGHAVHSVEAIHAIGVRGCASGSDGRLPANETTMLVMQQVQQVAGPGDLYLGRPDAAGVFHGVPEGEWVFVAFAPDHARTVTSCMVVHEGETSEVEVEFTPISAVTVAPADADCNADSWLGYWSGSYNGTHFQTGSGNSVSGKYNFHPDPQQGLYTIEGTVRTFGDLCIVEGTWSQGEGDSGYFVFYLIDGEPRTFAGHWRRGARPQTEEALESNLNWFGSEAGE